MSADSQRIKISPTKSYVLRRIVEGRVERCEVLEGEGFFQYKVDGFGDLDGYGHNAVEWLTARGFAHCQGRMIVATPAGRSWVQENS